MASNVSNAADPSASIGINAASDAQTLGREQMAAQQGRLLWGTTFARVVKPYPLYATPQQPPYPPNTHDSSAPYNYAEGGTPNRYSTYANSFRSFHLAFGRQTYLRSWSAGGVNRFTNRVRTPHVAMYDPSPPNSRTPVVPVWKRWLGDIPLFFQPVAVRQPPWARVPFNQP